MEFRLDVVFRPGTTLEQVHLLKWPTLDRSLVRLGERCQQIVLDMKILFWPVQGVEIFHELLVPLLFPDINFSILIPSTSNSKYVKLLSHK
jgi:hypothetical protein